MAPAENPACRMSEFFVSFEDLRSPRFEELNERYGLDDVAGDEKDEFKRILRLRHWTRGRMKVGSPVTPTRGDAFAILEAAGKGGQFQCGQFMVVQNAVMNAQGYVTRCLGAGPGGETLKLAGHHGVNEVWSNTLCKWFVSDAKYDIHFEKDGLPLSALDIRDELLKNGAKDVAIIQGPGRRTPEDIDWAARCRTYTWVSWETQGNRHSNFPRFFSSVLAVYEDEHFRENVWCRAVGGKVVKHWAYGADYFIPVRRRGWIEWTPNVLRVKARTKGQTARVEIRSCTPNFKEYQIREEGGTWKRTDERFSLRLSRPRHEWRLRSVNLAGVTGPEHRLVIERRKRGADGDKDGPAFEER